MEQPVRLFTRAEATELLPWLRGRLRELRDLKHAMDEALRRLSTMTPAMRSNGSALEGARLEEQADRLAAGMRSIIGEITSAGIEIKDIERGLVDFPALRAERVIYLCWMMDEEIIAYWHEVDAGFAGRHPFD